MSTHCDLPVGQLDGLYAIKGAVIVLTDSVDLLVPVLNQFLPGKE